MHVGCASLLGASGRTTLWVYKACLPVCFLVRGYKFPLWSHGLEFLTDLSVPAPAFGKGNSTHNRLGLFWTCHFTGAKKTPTAGSVYHCPLVWGRVRHRSLCSSNSEQDEACPVLCTMHSLGREGLNFLVAVSNFTPKTWSMPQKEKDVSGHLLWFFHQHYSLSSVTGQCSPPVLPTEPGTGSPWRALLSAADASSFYRVPGSVHAGSYFCLSVSFFLN